jgi:RimJ/RimL family protein N-acetyltransferase
MFQLMNDPDWIRNIGDRGIRVEEDARDYILNKIRPAYTERGMGFRVVRLLSNRQSIGIVGLVKRPFLDHVDIGFAFLPESRGFGYALEATKAIFQFGKKELGLDQISAITITSNQPSIRLLEKIGFAFDRMIKWPDDGTELMYYISQS